MTICTHGRDPVFARTDLGGATLAQLRTCAEQFGFDVIAYCLMPDHLHVLVAGTRADSDLKEFVRALKQRTAFHARQQARITLWQRSYFDRVLRDDEATEAVARYLLMNPVRAGLVASPEEYPLLGSCVTSVADLMARAQDCRGPA